ncbi:MAG: T9SS type A sorting domain-containing protein [Bacteroidales bacterium]|nr:T9SS type A sorting domain-containing protein [Bacteroidales bacterium]
MKKTLLFVFFFTATLMVMAQQVPQLKNNLPQQAAPKKMLEAIEPASTTPLPVASYTQGSSNGSKGIVSVIPIGTSANAYGYGYAGGQKTLVWADDNLKTVINTHRMGPGSTPPSLSGYIGIDRGLNFGATPNDWTNNYQIYNALMPGSQYYLDAARYPQGVIYNPEGNTDPANAYTVFFAPNLSSTATTWGGLSYGVANLMNNSDSTKHLRAYNPPPFTYIPDGMDINRQGVVLVSDIDQDWTTGSVVYQGNIIIYRGVWDAVEKDVFYEDILIPLETLNNDRPTNERVAFSPDGQTAWMVALANTGNLTTPGMLNYYPILYKSTDAGQTWEGPIEVQLDGENGIQAIVYELLDDTMIAALYNPPLPDRTQIGYTTAFDCDIVVDKFGNPHIGVIVGVTGSSDYSIVTAYGAFAAMDIYSIDGGNTWFGQIMGYPKQFRGTFGDLTEDNRIQIASNWTGDKVFVAWLDTDPTIAQENNQPDIYCRGFDLLANKVTGVAQGAGYLDLPNNVTYFSDVYFQAYFFGMSRYTLTDNDKYIVPFVVEGLTDPAGVTNPVQFKYIPDFYYTDADFVFPVGNPGVGIAPVNRVQAAISEINPNPVQETARVMISLEQPARISYSISTAAGQKVLESTPVKLNAGANYLSIPVSNLHSGLYFVTFTIDNEKVTRKMLVK